MRTLVILFTLLFTTLAHAGSTQSNVSGSNTAIEGGYTSSTTYQSGSSSNSTTTNSTTSNIRSSPPSAYAPGVNSSGIDVCSTGASMGVQTFGFGNYSPGVNFMLMPMYFSVIVMVIFYIEQK